LRVRSEDKETREKVRQVQKEMICYLCGHTRKYDESGLCITCREKQYLINQRAYLLGLLKLSLPYVTHPYEGDRLVLREKIEEVLENPFCGGKIAT